MSRMVSRQSGRPQRSVAPGQLAHRDAVLHGNGLSAATRGQANAGYDAVAAQYKANLHDPYAEVAARAREMGARYPGAYEAVAADAIQAGVGWYTPPRPQPLAGMPDLSSGGIFDGANVAGFRTTQWGAHGTDPDVYGVDIWSARERAGFMAAGSRGPGSLATADIEDARGLRVSGRLTVNETMSQRVPKGRPWLVLRTATSAECRVTAMMSGGFQQQRTFWIGGGSTASFLLGDYESATVEVVAASTATGQVQFAWISSGMEAGNQELYFPEVINGLAGATAVPEGAFAVMPDVADAAWTWDQPGVAGYTNTAGIAKVSSGVAARNPVGGSRYTPSVANSLLWVLRPI